VRINNEESCSDLDRVATARQNQRQLPFAQENLPLSAVFAKIIES